MVRFIWLQENYFFFKQNFTLDDNEPRSIFSNPRVRTQSALPDSMICFAIINAVEPVEQLLLTFIMGIPVIPTSYSARCPHVESP